MAQQLRALAALPVGCAWFPIDDVFVHEKGDPKELQKEMQKKAKTGKGDAWTGYHIPVLHPPACFLTTSFLFQFLMVFRRPAYYFAEFLSRSFFARYGIIMPSAVSTIGVIIFSAMVNISSEYMPSMQHAAVRIKHHTPKNLAAAWFFTNRYSAGIVSYALRSAR